MAAVGRFLLVAALIAAPWWFGCVQPWPQFVLGAVVAGLAVLRAVEALALRPDQSAHLPLAAAAPVVLLLISAVQLQPQHTPLPARMQHAVYQQDVGVFTGPQHAPSGTLSASDTRREAARLYLALAVFVLSAQWFADPATHRGLLGALALNGAALGAFGIIQRLTWNGLLFGSVPLDGGRPFASYVNRNNAAGYLNLCLAAAIGLSILIWWRPSPTGAQLRRLSDRVRLGLAQLDGVKLAALLVLIVTTAGVLFSLSRGGIVAMALAAVVVMLLAVRGTSRGGLLLLGGLILATALGIVSFSGQFEIVDERLDTLSDPLAAASGRLRHWSDTAGAVRDFPLLGSGLGTYRYANLPYQTEPSHAWYYNADNQWFEVLVETGAVGLTAAIAGFVLIGAAAVWLLRRGDPQSRAIGACGLFIVLTQAIQSVTDFGLLLPANAVTFAVLAGAVCGTACQTAQFERIRLPVWLSLAQLEGRAAQSLFSIVVAVAGGAFLLELYSASVADAASGRTVEIEADRTPVAALDESIARLNAAVALRPDDSRLHQSLGLQYARRCRLQLYKQLIEAKPAADSRQRRQHWNETSVASLGTLARQLRTSDNTFDLQRLRNLQPVQENLGLAHGHLEQALRHCPLSRSAALWLSRIEPLTGSIDASDAPPAPTLLAKARFVAPSTPSTLFELATLADISGSREFAAACWQRGLQFVPERAPQVWTALRTWRTPDEALATAVPARVDVLVAIAESVKETALRQEIADRADQLLQQQENSTDPLVVARLAELQARPEQAIHNYRLALADDPWDSITRLKLARLLDRQGRLSEAVSEYSLLRQQLPNRKDIQEQFDALKVRELEEMARQPAVEAGTSPNRSPERPSR